MADLDNAARAAAKADGWVFDNLTHSSQERWRKIAAAAIAATKTSPGKNLKQAKQDLQLSQ